MVEFSTKLGFICTCLKKRRIRRRPQQDSYGGQLARPRYGYGIVLEETRGGHIYGASDDLLSTTGGTLRGIPLKRALLVVCTARTITGVLQATDICDTLSGLGSRVGRPARDDRVDMIRGRAVIWCHHHTGFWEQIRAR